MASAQSNPQPLPPAALQAIARSAALRKLTPKQAAFAAHVVAGYTQTDAYRLSYDTAMADPRIDAYQTAIRPHVAITIAEGKLELNHFRSKDGQYWRGKIDDKLEEMIDDPLTEDNVLVSALRLAGSQRHVQAFSKALDAKDASAAAAVDMLDSIAQEIQQYRSSQVSTIDVAAIQESLHVVDSTATVCFRLLPMFELDECAGGGCD